MTGNNTSRKSLLKMPKLALVGKEAAGLCLWTTSLPLRLGLASPLLGHTCLHCRRVHVCEASPLSLPDCKDSEIHPPSIQYLFKLLITVKRSHKDCHTSFSHLLVHSHPLHSHPTQAYTLIYYRRDKPYNNNYNKSEAGNPFFNSEWVVWDKIKIKCRCIEWCSPKPSAMWAIGYER